MRDHGSANRKHRMRLRVAARDGRNCWLCDQPLLSLRVVHSSLDHVEPASLGGRFTFANLRLAHPTCNLVRGNVSAAEARRYVQLRLAGRLAPRDTFVQTFEEALAAQKQDEDRLERLPAVDGTGG